MISPQQPATSVMGELEWAQVMPAEAYWRARIATDLISLLCDEGYSDCWGVNGEHCEVIKEALDVAMGIKTQKPTE